MKLETLFTVKENKLFKIADNSQVDTNTLQRIEIPWSTVEMEDEIYNEEFLALLRDQLKHMETLNHLAVLVPIADKPVSSPEQQEAFINAFNHTARRVKDCTSVAGFEIIPELHNPQDFIDTLAVKHPQYVYFSKAENPSLKEIVKY